MTKTKALAENQLYECSNSMTQQLAKDSKTEDNNDNNKDGEFELQYG